MKCLKITCRYFRKFSYGFRYAGKSGIAGDRPLQHDKKIDHTSGLGADMYFSVPLDMTAIEKRAYYHLVNGHWLRKNRVFMVESPIADAIAMGIDPEKNQGSMIVNIGAQSTEFPS